MQSYNIADAHRSVEKTQGKNDQNWIFRAPTTEDGLKVNNLVAKTDALDNNSAYCNFLQTTHFKDTAVAALYKGRLAGFVSAYFKPSEPDTLFIWQVVVDSDFQGQGIAKKMIRSLLERKSNQSATAIETTITKNNRASWSLFRGIEKDIGEKGTVSVFLDHDMHFEGQHESEHLYRISLKSTH
ncbi:2,4-diaminobutyric acid acetyltransferase [Vibrio tubiashii]|nr:2,4-diaminobutyric acid acetyltransferase [Vibrio tubiashii]